MPEHSYLESGWCICGHHRQDGHRENKPVPVLTRQEIREILGTTYQPKEKQP